MDLKLGGSKKTFIMITKTKQKSSSAKDLAKFLPKFSPFKERLILNKQEKISFDKDRGYGGCQSWRS